MGAVQSHMSDQGKPMSRGIDDRVAERLRDPHHRAGFFGADAEIQLTQALDQIRRQKKVSQDELGRRLGVSQSAVSQFLAAEDGITIQRLVEYLVALDLQASISVGQASEDVTDPAVRVEIQNAPTAVTRGDESSIDLFAALHRSVKEAIQKSPPTKAREGRFREHGMHLVRDDEEQIPVAS
ncbi:MAG: XRE family transcriptional regulator [Acidimicrobiia bacterium]